MGIKSIKELRCFQYLTVLLAIFFLYGNRLMYKVGVRELNFTTEFNFV